MFDGHLDNLVNVRCRNKLLQLHKQNSPGNPGASISFKITPNQINDYQWNDFHMLNSNLKGGNMHT